jgi:hypothetical protein
MNTENINIFLFNIKTEFPLFYSYILTDEIEHETTYYEVYNTYVIHIKLKNGLIYKDNTTIKEMKFYYKRSLLSYHIYFETVCIYSFNIKKVFVNKTIIDIYDFEDFINTYVIMNLRKNKIKKICSPLKK